MVVTTTEFKTNLGKYLDLVGTEEVSITRNGRKIARLVKDEDNAISDIRSLFGILADADTALMSDDEIKDAIQEERGKRYDRIG